MLNQKSVNQAEESLKKVMQQTPLQHSERLSNLYNANIYLKREDLSPVRSFKIRGAYNKMCNLNDQQKKAGVVCASAGNHAQGVALSCSKLKIKGVIFMPIITPTQKVDKVKLFGGKYVQVQLVGNTFDQAFKASAEYATKHSSTYVHPFNDLKVMEGQATVAHEILEQMQCPDLILAAAGGGGLAAGMTMYLQSINAKAKVIACEPEMADSLRQALAKGQPVTLSKIDTFVDGAAVATIGELTFKVLSSNKTQVEVLPVGAICTAMIELYQNEGIIAEPAGALSVAALQFVKSQIKGKTVVCVISGGNNDLLRYPEILEKSLVYKGLKHYFVIEFAQRPGSLREFLNKALGPTDDIVLFEYLKRTNKERGSALVGIELKNANDLKPLLENLQKLGINYKKITSDDLVFNLLI